LRLVSSKGTPLRSERIIAGKSQSENLPQIFSCANYDLHLQGTRAGGITRAFAGSKFRIAGVGKGNAEGGGKVQFIPRYHSKSSAESGLIFFLNSD